MFSNGNIFALFALFGCIPLILGLFAFLPPRPAVIYGFLVAWLFLPMSHFKISGFPDYDKMSAACAGVLLGAAIFDSGALLSFRFKLIDLPMLIWCLCPFCSSLVNNLGIYDGLSAVSYQTTSWGLPYFIGRIYFKDLPGLRELAVGIVIGGLIYIPFCLFEIRMSPQLHYLVYGFSQHAFDQTLRWGGYRPMVFMQHGLAVGVWMAAATLCAFWLWRGGILARQMEWLMIGCFGLVCLGALANLSFVAMVILAGGGLFAALGDRARTPAFFGFIALLATLWMCHAAGAVVLLILGFAALLLTQVLKNPLFIILLLLAAPIYITLRASQLWSGADMVRLASLVDDERAESLQSRLDSEDILAKYALQSPLFGWGGWDRARPHGAAHWGIPDALWIIAIGANGLVGLISLTSAILLPVAVLLRRIPARYWATAAAAPAAVLAVLLALHMIDNLFNAMVNPIFILAAGGLCGLAPILKASTAPSPVGQRGNAGLAAPNVGGGRPAW